MQVGKALGRENGDFPILNAGIGGEGVTDAVVVEADQPDDVAGIGIVDGFAFIAKELVRTGQAHLPAGSGMDDRHVALKLARADAGKSDAVAVLGIHVGLDLEDEGGEGLVIGRDGDFLTVPGHGWRKYLRSP